jgi:hypothetical protein
MEQKRPQSKQTKASREATPTNEQINLTRAAHKIAWTRMNGRNDALNPFAEPQPDQSTEQRGE